MMQDGPPCWIGRRPTSVLAHIVLVLLVAVVGCRGGNTRRPGGHEGARLEAERLERHLARHPADDEAWRDLALIRWIHLQGFDQAKTIAARLADKGDLVSRTILLVMADARLEARETREHAYRVLEAAAAGFDDPLVLGLGVFAAEKIGEQHGLLADDDDAYRRLFASLAVDRLPYELRRPLLSLRASIARRLGEPYREYYDREGCVRRFSVGVVEGSAGAIELGRRRNEPFVADPEAHLVELSCVVRIWNPTPRSGIRRLRTWVHTSSDRLRLELSAQHASRFHLDGKLVHRTDRIDRWPADRVILELDVAPGWHELTVATAIPEERAWVLVRATERDGSAAAVALEPSGPPAPAFAGKARAAAVPWNEPIGRLKNPYTESLRHYLALERALSAGDSDRAESLVAALRDVENFAEGQLAVARFERDDPSRPRTLSATRERAALHRAVSAAPDLDRARLRLFELSLDRGEDAEVLAALRALPKGRLGGIEGELLRFRVSLARGNEAEAEKALARARKRNPKSCDVLTVERGVARQRGDVRREDDLVQALAHCPGTLGLRARLAEQRGRRTEAKALWQEAIDRTPDDTSALEALASLAVLDDDRAGAIAFHQRILAFNPFRVGSHVAIADLLAGAGRLDEARQQIHRALRFVPHSSGLRQAGEALGIPDDLFEFRVDGAAALAEYRKTKTDYEGVSEVLVLDRSVARVYDNAASRVIVHMVVELRSKEALDHYGELGVPDDGRLLTMRTIKPDGTIREPEIVPGKDGVSLRHLEIGDAVEVEYVVDREPAGLLPGFVDVTTFRFQSLDVPYHKSELIVVHPAGFPLHEERRNDPPKVSETRRGDLVVKTYLAREMPRLGVEPQHRALLDELPNVRLYTGLAVEDWLDTVSLQLRNGQRTNAELRALVKQLVAGIDDPEARLHKLWAWVIDNVEDSSDLTASATATLAVREGNRTMLLLAMLREAGIRAELWLARNRFGPRIAADGNPMVESYDTAMLAVWPGPAKDPIMVLTSSKVMPLGYLPPAFSRTAALRVALDGRRNRSARVELPKSPAGLIDKRNWTLELDIDGEGEGTITGRLELQGMEALAWRQALRDIDRDRIEEAFQQAELARLLRGATLTELTIEHEEDLDIPLVLRFRATASEVGVRQGGALVLPSSIVPMNPGSDYTSLPRRKTGLVIPYGPVQEATITIKLRGARFDRLPAADRIDATFGAFERRVEGKKGDQQVTIRVRSALTARIVEPADYGRLREFVQGVEAASRDIVRVR